VQRLGRIWGGRLRLGLMMEYLESLKHGDVLICTNFNLRHGDVLICTNFNLRHGDVDLSPRRDSTLTI